MKEKDRQLISSVRNLFFLVKINSKKKIPDSSLKIENATKCMNNVC